MPRRPIRIIRHISETPMTQEQWDAARRIMARLVARAYLRDHYPHLLPDDDRRKAEADAGRPSATREGPPEMDFPDAIAEMPKLMEQLRAVAPVPWGTPSVWPKRGGVYVLWEDGSPLYVGRSDNLRQRIQQHGRASSGHNAAPFAFNLAKAEAAENGVEVKGRPRAGLQADPAFSALFAEAKERVRHMAVTAITVEDPILQTLFEVYVHLELKTPLNDFRCH